MSDTERDLETVLSAYITCALWSSNDYWAEDEDPEPFDSWASRDDIAAESVQSMREDCAAMIDGAKDVVGSEWWDDEQFGHDFWLTRNRHGAGFWDRHYGDERGSLEDAAGDKLTKMAHIYGESDLYTGDDGKVYV